MSDDVSAYAEVIDIPSLSRNWPLGHDVPPLIFSIAELLRTEATGSVGYFEMKGVRFDDYWIENGADLCEQFGFFLTLPEGSKIGLWFHDGVVTGSEPVIVVGSEGDLKVLGANLKAFLADWADGKAYQDLSLQDEEDTPEARASWHHVGANIHALIDAAPDHPAGALVGDLPKFLEGYGKAARRIFA